MLLKPLTVYMDINGDEVVQSGTRKTIYAYTDATLLRMVSPKDRTLAVDINFQLSDGSVIESKNMTLDADTETVGEEEWNVWYYRPSNVVTARVTSSKVSTAKCSFTQYEIIADKTYGDTFGEITLSVKPTILPPSADIADATVAQQLADDLATLTGLLENKVDKDISGYTLLDVVDPTQSYFYVYYNGNVRKISMNDIQEYYTTAIGDLQTDLNKLLTQFDQTTLDSALTPIDQKLSKASDVEFASVDTTTAEFDSMDLYNDVGDVAQFTYDGTRVNVAYGDVNLELGENNWFIAKASAPVTEGQVIQYGGTDGASGKLLGKPAVASEVNASPTLIMGVATETVALNGTFRVNAFGQVNIASQLAINGTPSATGILYFDSTSVTDGKLTYDKPVAPNVQIELCALVYQNPSTTILQVRPTFSLALGDLHDVYTNGGLTDKDILWWNTANNRWELINLFDGATISSTYLPSYVDDVLEYADFASLPVTGETSKIYVTLDDNAQYRWSGSTYVSMLGTAEQTAVTNTSFDKLFKDANITNVQEALSFIDDNVAPALDGEPNGFVDRTQVTPSFVNATRTLTLTGTYDFYLNGVKFTKTNDTYVLPDLEGGHYVYYNNAGVLTSTQTFTADIIERYAFVAYVYWDATNKVSIPNILNETHGVEMPSEVHSYLHRNEKTRYVSGLALTLDATGAGTLDSHIQFTSSVGQINDEDILHTVVARTTLATTIPVLYRDGVSNWRMNDTRSFPVINGGTGRVMYNENVGGSFQLTEVTNTKFMLTHIYAIPNATISTGRLIAIIGQNEYATVNDARAGAEEEAFTINTSGLPLSELKLVGTLIVQTSTAYTNTAKARFVQTDTGADYIDWRSATPTFTGGISASQWGTITGTITDQADLVALINENTTVLKYQRFIITNVDNGDGTFSYTWLGNARTGTLSAGVYTFTLEESVEYIQGSNRIKTIINNDLTYSGIDVDEFTETSTTTFSIQYAFQVSDDITVEVHQGLDTVSVSVGADTITRTELAQAVEDDIDAGKDHSLVVTGNPHSVTKTEVGLGNVTNDAQVKKRATSTDGRVPSWNGTTGDALNDGYAVETTLTGGANELVRADAIKTYVDAKHANYTVTIASADTWTDQTTHFTLAKTVSGILATDEPIIDLDLSSATVSNIADIQTAWGTIYRAVTSTDTITFYALESPTFPEDTVLDILAVR